MSRDWEDQEATRISRGKSAEEAYADSSMARARKYYRAGARGETLRMLADPRGRMGEHAAFLRLIERP